jgi:molybdate transport system substrate-binding protein
MIRFLVLPARAIIVAGVCLFALTMAASAEEITVMSSGGFTAALKELAPKFEQASGHHVHIVLGPSMGTAPEAIPNRLQRGEPADLLIMVGYALDNLCKAGVVDPASAQPLANSKIALAVKDGQPKPDIHTIEAFKQTLLAAKSIAYSDSASGVYIENEMYKKLGLEDQLKGKSRMIVADPVGGVVAKGEAEVGFQQVSELLPVKGILLVGTIPDEVQKVTVFSAGIPTSSHAPLVAKQFLAFLAAPDARPTVEKTGLEPTGLQPR